MAEALTFFSDGLRMSALFYPSRDAPGPGVVFCPGSRVTKETPYYHEYIPRLVDAGLSVLLFDYRGWGESEGAKGTLYPAEQVEDIRNALTCLGLRPEVDPRRMGLIGMSMGGALAMQATALDERVRAVVAVLSPMDGRKMLRGSRREYEWTELRETLASDRRQRVETGTGGTMDHFSPPTPERGRTTALAADPIPPIPIACVQAIHDFRPVELVHLIAPRGAMWIAATADPTCPVEHSQRAYAAAGSPKRLVEIDSSEHYGTYVKHADAILDEAVNWFDGHLGSAVITRTED